MLGRWQIAVLIGGIIGLLGAMAFLRYLWPWESRGGSQNTWKTIVFSGWMLRFITLTSIVIRASMAMQATVFCMVIASISLQRGQVIMRDVAAVSIFRFSNAGPHSMIPPLFRSCKEWKSFLAIIMTGLLSITTIASQFTSTILLIDIGTQNLKTREQTFNISYGDGPTEWDMFYVSSTADSWDDRPATLPVFAEKAGKNIQLSGHKNGSALFATGSNLQALLPLDKQNRTSLAEYQGPAAVVDSRVVCMSPYIETLWITQENGTEWLRIYGEIYPSALDHYSDELVDLGFFTSKPGNLSQKIIFYCKGNSEWDSTNSGAPFAEWKVSLCQLWNPYLMTADGGTDFFGGSFDLGFVVLNMTGSDELWYNVSISESDIGFGKGGDGEWVNFSFPASDEEGASQLDISVSLCFLSYNAVNALVTARAEWNLTEPVLSKSSNALRYNTTSFRSHLGVGEGVADLDYKSRGILELVDIDHQSITDLPEAENWIKESLVPMQLGPSGSNSPTLRMCITCNLDVRVHEGFISIFQDTLAITSHPALALQALLTSRALQIYDDRMPDFSTSASATVSLVKPFQVPTVFRGFYVIFSLIGFHMILMVYIFVLFFKLEGHTSLGQAWQAVAQLHGEETEEIMAIAATSTDSEVAKWLSGKGEYRSRFGIHGGRIRREGTRNGRTGLGNDLEHEEEPAFVRPRSVLSFRSRVSTL